MTDKTCATCEWHDSLTGVCINADSVHHRDWTAESASCDEWSERELVKERTG